MNSYKVLMETTFKQLPQIVLVIFFSWLHFNFFFCINISQKHSGDKQIKSHYNLNISNLSLSHSSSSLYLPSWQAASCWQLCPSDDTCSCWLFAQLPVESCMDSCQQCFASPPASTSCISFISQEPLWWDNNQNVTACLNLFSHRHPKLSQISQKPTYPNKT